MHARNKPIPRGDDDALLHAVAELTIGYSGAELANLLNEAAILAVGPAVCSTFHFCHVSSLAAAGRISGGCSLF